MTLGSRSGTLAVTSNGYFVCQETCALLALALIQPPVLIIHIIPDFHDAPQSFASQASLLLRHVWSDLSLHSSSHCTTSTQHCTRHSRGGPQFISMRTCRGQDRHREKRFSRAGVSIRGSSSSDLKLKEVE